ncbi:MAG: cytochrome b N-terminal domain-containing protein [Rickettsiales bacterium]|nr:cytochrome b N-terminal domain-containing protein [Rickettsiales bacterium]
MALHHKSPYKGVAGWLDTRLPILYTIDKVVGSKHPTPRNLNYWWNFGSLAGLCLVVQIMTGLFLAMHYAASTDIAFDSVEHIMRDVNYGWLIRYMHAVGASMFFIVVYVHIFRGLYYGSYKFPREVLWWLGVVILLLMMGTAFMGYVLPWGQMSFWGATVITNLFSAFPIVGDSIVTLLWGGFSVDNPTLNRFFALHFLLPFVIVGVVMLHILALNAFGSSNPTGIDVKSPQDTIPFHPYYSVKDFFGFGVFFLVFAAFVFFAPNYLGHADNYIEANPLVTPAHIVPEWYFLPFYAILRAVTFDIPFYLIGLPLMGFGIWMVKNCKWTASLALVVGTTLSVLGLAGFGIDSKLGGVLAMFGSILVLFVIPWLDTSPVRSTVYRPLYRWFFWLFALNSVVLGYAGSQPADWGTLLDLPQSFNDFNIPDITVSLIATGYYFAHFFVVMPLIGKIEKPLPLPESINASVLKKA